MKVTRLRPRVDRTESKASGSQQAEAAGDLDVSVAVDESMQAGPAEEDDETVQFVRPARDDASGERPADPASGGGRTGSGAAGHSTRRRKWAWALAGAALAAAGLLFVATRAEPEQPVAQDQPTRVRVVPVRMDDGVRKLRVSGVTAAAKQAKLSFTVGGRLAERPVEIGDTVEEGDVLARLDEEPLKNRVESAKAKVQQLQAKLGRAYRDRRRTYDLSQADVTSSAQMDDATAAVQSLRAGRESARAQLEEAKRMLDEATLEAPFDGSITEVMLEPGEFATPGRPVMVLSGEQGLEVEVELPESEIHRIDTGDGVRVDLPLAGKKGLEGTVHSVGRSASRAGRVFPVVVRLEPAQGVVSGMAAEVVFRTEHEPALSVPVASVINPGGQHPAVFRVKDDVAERVKVEVHELKDERVTLEGPLEPGDRVVVGGHGALVDGERVKPRTARKEKAKDDEGESGAEES